MKAKINRGAGQKSLIAYVFEGQKGSLTEKHAKLIGGTCAGSTKEEIQDEFTALRKIRPDIGKPAWHCSLSLKPPERLSDEQWSDLAAKYMKGMGYSDRTLYIVVRHHDTEHDHIHIVASRIGLDGKIYLGQKEAAKSMPLTNELAKEFGLSELAHETRVEKKGITMGERGLAERTGEVPVRIQLQVIIDEAVTDKPNFTNFVSRLEAAGVSIIPSGKTGQAQGITFELDGIPFTGTKLGDHYKWKPLQRRIDYDPERDQPELNRLRQQAAKADEAVNGTITLGYPVVPHQGRKYQQTLELAFEKDGDIWKWKNRQTKAFTDMGDKISVNSSHPTAIKAALQLGRNKWGDSICVTGTEIFRRKSWLIGSEMGLKIQGYEPSETDLAELAFKLAEKERKKHERKNSTNAATGRDQRESSQDDRRVNGADREISDQPNTDSRRHGNEDRAINTSDQRTGREANTVNGIQTAGTDHIQCPSMANDDRGGDNRSDLDRLRLGADNVSDLAATTAAQQQNRTERSDTTEHNPVAADRSETIKAWEKQHDALGAEKYRITLKPRTATDSLGKKLYEQNFGNRMNQSQRDAAGLEEKFWTPEEVKGAIYQLRAKHTLGYDIYITPIDGKSHYLVVDNMNNLKLAGLLKRGIAPAIIQKSSDHNQQAIVRIEKQNGPNEQALANKLAVALNKIYGDGKAINAVHPLKMAGFRNKKAGKGDYFTINELSIRRMCSVTSTAMQKMRDSHRLKTEEAVKLKERVKFDQTTTVAHEGHLAVLSDAKGDVLTRAYNREVSKKLEVIKAIGRELDGAMVDHDPAKSTV